MEVIRLNKFLLVISLILTLVSPAAAQYSAQLSAAETVVKGSSRGAGFIAIYEDALGALGEYRTGFGGYSDLGAKVAIIDLDAKSAAGDVGLMLGLDTKYQVMELRIQDPMDLSIGGMTEISLFSHVTNISFGGFVIGSYPIALNSGRHITPFGRVIMRIDRTDPDFGTADSDFNIGLNIGGSLELSSSTKAIAEIQLDNQSAFMMGVQFGL